ncbi:sperm acrosome associated 6 [Labrus mixtus]|uniref:sperm acrosome associated 6 n=1 Tax=Labrus mixtus TaxID=508554 RepID=UPI0029BFCC6A|nr:sperm acrosome associated 6 [Labrus mixtus]
MLDSILNQARKTDRRGTCNDAGHVPTSALYLEVEAMRSSGRAISDTLVALPMTISKQLASAPCICCPQDRLSSLEEKTVTTSTGSTVSLSSMPTTGEGRGDTEEESSWKRGRNAGKGKGYDKQLKELLDLEILSIVEEFDEKENKDTVYEQRLQTAADNFIAAASKLPRVSGCFPPCGFQSAGAVYNCVTCKYDSCEFPLDCPVKDIQVMENSRSQVRCDVPFRLPNDIEVIWRFAEELKTQQVDQFKEVTAGMDKLYSIRSTSLHHQGTYQCEIYSGARSIVRLYYYLTVTPQVVVGHTELQEIFDMSLLPGGRLVPAPDGSLHPPLLLPSPLLLTTCLTCVLLLLFLSLGALYLSSRITNDAEQEIGDEDLGFFSESTEQ